MKAIVAVYEDWGIGINGTQPVVIPEDRVYFRDITGGCPIIYGRRTMEDFPGGKPLKNRFNFVLTRQNIEIDGAVVVHSVEEALDAVKHYGEEVFVIGGESVFKAFVDYFSTIYVTKIAVRPESDAFFPNLDDSPHWSCTYVGEEKEYNGIQYYFCIYKRI